jgi:hypothetical protein
MQRKAINTVYHLKKLEDFEGQYVIRLPIPQAAITEAQAS